MIAFASTWLLAGLMIWQVGLTAYTAIEIQATKSGAGRHQWDVSINAAIYIAWLSNILQVVYCPVILIAKLSLLIQTRRVFSGTKRNFLTLSATVLIWTNTLFYAACMVAVIFTCTPREAIWNPLVAGSCLDQDGLILSATVINLISDILIFTLPIVAVWQMNVTRRKKLRVGSIFATALL